MIVVDRHKRGRYIAVDFSLGFSGISVKTVLMGERGQGYRHQREQS